MLQANYTLKTSKQTHLKIKSVVTRGRGRERELDEGSQKLQTKKKKKVLKFEMIVDLCAAVRNNRELAYPLLSSPDNTFVTIVQYHNQTIDTIIPEILTIFHEFYMHLFVCIFNKMQFDIARIDSSNCLHCPNRDEVHHQKDTSIALLRTTGTILPTHHYLLETTNLSSIFKLWSFQDCHINGRIIEDPFDLASQTL